MTFLLLSAQQIVDLHDGVLNPGELQGMAKDKSLDGALSRVENRLSYGMITDVFALATAYAMAVAQGHCFNDGNKRTAYRTLIVSLFLKECGALAGSADGTPVVVAEGTLMAAGARLYKALAQTMQPHL